MRELNEKWLESKQLKPNGQMERMVKMTKKDQGDMEKKNITPTQSKTVHGN